MSRRRKRLEVSIRHQVTVEVDRLTVVLDRDSLVVAVKTSYVLWVHERRRETVDVWTELEVMVCVSVTDHQACPQSQHGNT